MYLANVSRNAAQAQKSRERTQFTGVTTRGRLLWPASEDEVCRRHYPDYDAMRKLLPHRTRGALKKRCGALKITNARTNWTAKENSLFRRVYRSGTTEELIAAFPVKSLHALYERGYRLGLVRPVKPFKLTGDPLLDDLRQYCRRSNLTMLDVEKFVPSAGYFSGKGWRGGWGNINYHHIVRAIHELGGTLAIHWSVQ
ncbi:hypothetical protein FJW04_24130 [Mesorhizobium sp. B2-7-3]|uniref:hypothetical protein n=1 Tax=Mesorhizobium sp. B2-7-3 TaxID=2589907 RepID=UPI00112906E3|nr:hypothetical protein [Mesorhizobium sp. B2-7-3]TPJ11449.1 hypothetical protein FJW04_24130 [Mesorhizobium sp. B2-7-3]